MTGGHIGNLALRRLRAGELGGDEARTADSHAQDCPECQRRMRELDEEQAAFRQEISFERFASGVERAGKRGEKPSRTWIPSVAGMAAAAAVTLIVGQPLTRQLNRSKGPASVVLRIAGPLGGPQRLASPGIMEPLGVGDRVRIGYRPAGHRFVAALSVDQGGVVTPIYPEFGDSIPADEGDATYYLPDSIEFTGKGQEAVVVVLSDQPLHVADLTQATRRGYDEARGDLSHLKLTIPGDQFVRVFLKP